jgi:hypothetical protein
VRADVPRPRDPVCDPSHALHPQAHGRRRRGGDGLTFHTKVAKNAKDDDATTNQPRRTRKSVESLLPLHEAQLLTYLKLTGCKVGLLINFNVPLLKQGIKRFVL